MLGSTGLGDVSGARTRAARRGASVATRLEEPAPDLIRGWPQTRSARPRASRRAACSRAPQHEGATHPTFKYAKPLACNSATVATPDGTNRKNSSLRVLAGSMFSRL